MSDDLVKRWDEYVESMGSVMGEVEYMAQQMRDRIEELEANINTKADFIDATINQLAASDQRIEELEAKLAEYNLLWQAYELDKVVAELKGQKDE